MTPPAARGRCRRFFMQKPLCRAWAFLLQQGRPRMRRSNFVHPRAPYARRPRPPLSFADCGIFFAYICKNHVKYPHFHPNYPLSAQTLPARSRTIYRSPFRQPFPYPTRRATRFFVYNDKKCEQNARQSNFVSRQLAKPHIFLLIFPIPPKQVKNIAEFFRRNRAFWHHPVCNLAVAPRCAP